MKSLSKKSLRKKTRTTNSTNPILASYLRSARINKGLSQAEVAHIIGLDNGQFISNIERGTCPIPLEKLKLLIQIYEIPTSKVIALILKHTKSSLKQEL